MENTSRPDFMSSPIFRDGDEETSKDQLLSMGEAFNGLRDMEASFFHAINYLITQVVLCAPSRNPTTLPILETLRDAAFDFLNPLVFAWRDMPGIMDYFSCVLEDAQVGEGIPSLQSERYESMRLNAQHARDALPLLDISIINILTPLTLELRGSFALEPILRTLKYLPWSSSMRVDLLDDLPQLISDLRSYCQGAMQYFDIAEGLIVRLHDFCSDEERVAALAMRVEVGNKLHDLSRFARDRILRTSSHAYDLGRKGSSLPVNDEYMGQEYLKRYVRSY